MTIKANKSGELDIDRKNDYYRCKWDEIGVKAFNQTVFQPYSALVFKDLVNGHRMFQPYSGGPYDKDKYDLVKDQWDHEHCSICNFKIMKDCSYWFNTGRVHLLCDACYDFYIKA
jgi:hypothetical protein